MWLYPLSVTSPSAHANTGVPSGAARSIPLWKTLFPVTGLILLPYFEVKIPSGRGKRIVFMRKNVLAVLSSCIPGRQKKPVPFILSRTVFTAWIDVSMPESSNFSNAEEGVSGMYKPGMDGRIRVSPSMLSEAFSILFRVAMLSYGTEHLAAREKRLSPFSAEYE